MCASAVPLRAGPFIAWDGGWRTRRHPRDVSVHQHQQPPPVFRLLHTPRVPPTSAGSRRPVPQRRSRLTGGTAGVLRGCWDENAATMPEASR